MTLTFKSRSWREEYFLAQTGANAAAQLKNDFSPFLFQNHLSCSFIFKTQSSQLSMLKYIVKILHEKTCVSLDPEYPYC